MSDTSPLHDDPDLPQSSAPQLGIPGTPEFFASVLRFIRTTTPGFPLDPVIFQSVILSVMAGNKHLLLRAKDEDIGIVQNLAVLIFTDVLGYTTHKHKTVPPSDMSPSSFISSLFSSPYQGAATGRSDSSFKRRAKRPRSQPTSESHKRQTSELTASSSDTSPTSPGERPDVQPKQPRLFPFNTTITRSSSSGAVQVGYLRVQQVSETSALPSALVLTGLEHCSVPCHRTLLRVLLEKRVAFGEDLDGPEISFRELPQDFILVYVCPFDPRERPPIHKSLVRRQLMTSLLLTALSHPSAQLDKFSLSVAVALHPSTRDAHATYRSSDFSGTQTPSPSLPPTQPTPNPILPRDFLPRLRSFSTPEHVNIHPSIRLYIADLISAARHHRELDGTLLGVRSVEDAEALVRAHRVLGAGDVGSALIERTAALSVTSAAVSTLSLHHPVGADVAVHLHWVEEGTLTTASPRRPAFAASGVEADWLHFDPRTKWDVSEVDAAKVVPRVISHRLRVRDGPEDELMAGVIFMATAPRVPTGFENDGTAWRRRTVKEILVKLMAHV